MMASTVARDVVYMAGIDYDMEQFKRELQQVAEYSQQRQAA